MTDRPSERPTPATGSDDPTRDIRLPPLPGRPTPAVPAEWAALHQQPAADQSVPEQPEPDRPAREQPEPDQPETDQLEQEHPTRQRIADEPTDELGQPPAARQRTLAFAAPSGGNSPATADPAVQSPPGYSPSGRPQPGAVAPSRSAARPGPRPRRPIWPWVLVLVVLLLLFAAAVVLGWVSGDRDTLQSFWEAGAPLGYRPG